MGDREWARRGGMARRGGVERLRPGCGGAWCEASRETRWKRSRGELRDDQARTICQGRLGMRRDAGHLHHHDRTIDVMLNVCARLLSPVAGAIRTEICRVLVVGPAFTFQRRVKFGVGLSK